MGKCPPVHKAVDTMKPYSRLGTASLMDDLSAWFVVRLLLGRRWFDMGEVSCERNHCSMAALS